MTSSIPIWEEPFGSTFLAPPQTEPLSFKISAEPHTLLFERH